jgi:hypothetical protein
MQSQSLSRSVPGEVRVQAVATPALREAVDERWGLLAYAGSVFCSSMMSIFARLAEQAGVSPWQIVFVRSVLLLMFSSCNLATLPSSPFGARCRVGN